ncbi:DUF7844 domain-containing protein [Bdellovibrio reynosensis]|uniref:DUF4105 domain-containing protein n=1 Tax=Bdellovibrio reynosensis TaxID=2835041 RepID=A0ABY4CAZ9_9BACT|nr:DUF4105 domain-containing protein [Bdellovibrio reynosensis]UOF02120.1 DUF4105 domain-containing protein [Bdellovibrio reynosensis]
MKTKNHFKKLFFLAVLLLAPAVTIASPVFKLPNSPKTKHLNDSLKSIFSQAETLLPAEVKNVLPKPILVRFERFHDDSFVGKAEDHNSLILNEKLIPEILKGETNSTVTGRRHGNMYREILATILHEATHLYERNLKHPPSENRYFLALAGWPPKLTTGTPKNFNGYTVRSVDLYELKNPREMLAVNMEYFLLDSEFKCRKPSLYRFLKDYFKHIPFENPACTTHFTFMNSISREDVPFISIDPKLVYQIHYLMAGPGKKTMSRWGHTFLRIVTCDPERKAVGPECLNDVAHHVVFSFRGFVDDFVVDQLKGINGSYPSRLFVLSMGQIITEYNKTEMRDLRSYPMQLSETKKLRLLEKIFETHWTYDGKYKFFSSNCAIETLNLLKGALPDTDLIKARALTPNGVLKDLAKAGFIQYTGDFSRRELIERGLLFESYAQRLNQALDIAGMSRIVGYDDYLKLKTSYLNRYFPADLSRKKAAAFYILESARQRKYRSRLYNVAVKSAMQAKSEGRKSRLGDTPTKNLDLARYFASPGASLNQRGYGIPSLEELQNSASDVLDKSSSGKFSETALKESAKNTEFSFLAEELTLIENNLAFLKERMKSSK